MISNVFFPPLPDIPVFSMLTLNESLDVDVHVVSCIRSKYRYHIDSFFCLLELDRLYSKYRYRIVYRFFFDYRVWYRTRPILIRSPTTAVNVNRRPQRQKEKRWKTTTRGKCWMNWTETKTSVKNESNVHIISYEGGQSKTLLWPSDQWPRFSPKDRWDYHLRRDWAGTYYTLYMSYENVPTEEEWCKILKY